MFGRQGRLLEAVEELQTARVLLEPLKSTSRHRGSLIGALWELHWYLDELCRSDPSDDGWKNQLKEVEEKLKGLGETVDPAVPVGGTPE